MKTKTYFVANDGSEWETEEKAASRNDLLNDVAAATELLGDRSTDTNFVNGGGYFQHTANAVHLVKKHLYELVNVDGVLKQAIDWQKQNHGRTDADFINSDGSWIHRMLDGSPGPLNAAYYRLGCIDSQYREWGQPYFALNPGKGQPVCLN